MATSILTILTTVLVPVIKWIIEKREGRKLTDQEFTAIILTHQEHRDNAGQAALDWKTSVAKLKEQVAKKNDEDLKEK